jgi:hypothetical protein
MVQVSKIRDEITRVPTGVADTVGSLADKVELPQVDLRHVADQVTGKLTSGTDELKGRAKRLANRPQPKRRTTRSPIVGVGLLLLVLVVVVRFRARNGRDEETT